MTLRRGMAGLLAPSNQLLLSLVGAPACCSLETPPPTSTSGTCARQKRLPCEGCTYRWGRAPLVIAGCPRYARKVLKGTSVSAWLPEAWASAVWLASCSRGPEPACASAEAAPF